MSRRIRSTRVLIPETERTTQFAANPTIKVPIVDGTKVPVWCSATPDKGTYVERTGSDAKTGTSLNFTVYGSL